MEPVCPTEDFLTTRGTVAPAKLAVYDVAKDVPRASKTPGDLTSPWAAPVEIRGSHGVEQKTSNRGAGDIVTVTTDWWITGLTPDILLDEPTINSKILSCGKVWLILDVSPNARNRRLYLCKAQLSPGG